MRAWLPSLPWALWLALAVLLQGCGRPGSADTAMQAPSPVTSAAPSVERLAPGPALAPPVGEPDPALLAAAPTLIEVEADEAPAAALRRELAAAAVAGQSAVVYVGAEWCAPCKVFRAALRAGELASALPGLRFVGLDHDHHGEGLRAMGYAWQFVPMFALPGPGGRAAGQGFGGVPMDVKDAPVAHLVARVRALVGRPARPTDSGAPD